MFDYIIVQAGGKGTRMERLTRNKPKALVPVRNAPMIFHLFRKYPDKQFIIIGDYKYEVLSAYLKTFASVNYKLVCGAGHSGTCSGLKEALSLIPDDCSFMLIWCDLILPDDYQAPTSNQNVIGISKDFPCRWKYNSGNFVEERSADYGVAGLFIFRDKSYLKNVPLDGEFVRWLQGAGITFESQPLYNTHEYGLIEEWEKLPKLKCRPFNSIRVDGERLYKMPIDDQGASLARKEINWYRAISDANFHNVPMIYSFDPLCMERIHGKNIYEYESLSLDEKERILIQIIHCLKDLHAIKSVPSDKESFTIAYLSKTFDRLNKIKHLVPFAGDEFVLVNGKRCHNVFFIREKLEKIVMSYFPHDFCLIHGDCTFSNIILKEDKVPVFIDPRGYFGNTDLYGDAAYDWAKLYYSLISNYDRFNLKKFELHIEKDGVDLRIESNHWEALEDTFFNLLNGEVTRKQMKLMLSIIWLSLTTYAWEDYDSICGAFYNGLYYLEEAMNDGCL